VYAEKNEERGLKRETRREKREERSRKRGKKRGRENSLLARADEHAQEERKERENPPLGSRCRARLGEERTRRGKEP
jgi:hypothetical protein